MLRKATGVEQSKRSGWTQERATRHICAVNRGREKYGLSYISACDFLHISLAYAKNMK